MATDWREQYLRYKDFYLNIQSLYKKRADLRAFLEIILSLSAIIVFLVFALKPTALTIISLYNQIQDKNRMTATLAQKINDLQSAQNTYNQNKNYITDIDNSVGSVPRPDFVTKQVIALANKDSVTVIGISIGETTIVGAAPQKSLNSTVDPMPDGSYDMPISINISGTYQNDTNFLKDLENLRTTIKIDSVAFKSTVTKNGTTIVIAILGRVPYIGQ